MPITIITTVSASSAVLTLLPVPPMKNTVISVALIAVPMILISSRRWTEKSWIPTPSTPAVFWGRLRRIRSKSFVIAISAVANSDQFLRSYMKRPAPVGAGCFCCCPYYPTRRKGRHSRKGRHKRIPHRLLTTARFCVIICRIRSCYFFTRFLHTHPYHSGEEYSQTRR